MEKIRLSNTQIDLYETCPKKYFFRYRQNLKGDYTATPLLFGSAIDNALNYILESIRDKKEWSKEVAIEAFHNKMCEWDGQNRLDFFKNEVPPELLDIYDEGDPDHWEAVWEHIYKRGLNCLDTYINDVLPLIESVGHVQNKGVITNADGHEFVYVIDFIAKLKDGRTVLFDNKTASAKYPKNKVVTSQQLSLYLESFPDIKYCGYIVLIKDPGREKGMKFQILVDEIPEETKVKSFDKLDKTLYSVSREEFPCNYKSCKKFNKHCEYSRACQYNDFTGLIPAYVKKENKDGTLQAAV